jgi:hypothetical protein
MNVHVRCAEPSDVHGIVTVGDHDLDDAFADRDD